MRRSLPLFLAVAVLSFVSTARAGILIEITESGSDVLITTSGDLNTTGLVDPTRTTNQRTWAAGSGTSSFQVWVAFAGSPQEYYSGDDDGLVGYNSTASWTGDTFLISGASTLLDSGDASFGFRTGLANIWTPENYVSGTSVTQVLRRQNASFASLGLNVGDFAEVNWTGTGGGSGDTMRMQVGPTTATVPEPTSLAIFGLGTLGLAAGSIRRRKRA